jgi:hypothetical protein
LKPAVAGSMPKPALDGLLIGFRTALSLLPPEAQIIFAGKLERLAADIRQEVQQHDNDDDGVSIADFLPRRACKKKPGRACQGDYGSPMRCEWCDRVLDDEAQKVVHLWLR